MYGDQANDLHMNMQRIAVIGPSGAGKSTLARRLGELTGLPVIHLDAHYFQPGWKAMAEEEWEPLVRQLAAGERWVIDGNFSKTMDVRLSAADTIIFLDFSRWRCLWGVLKRLALNVGRTRADMAKGCVEKLDLEFLAWVWNFPHRSRPTVIECLQRFADGRQVYVLKSFRDVENFVQTLEREAQGQPA